MLPRHLLRREAIRHIRAVSLVRHDPRGGRRVLIAAVVFEPCAGVERGRLVAAHPPVASPLASERNPETAVTALIPGPVLGCAWGARVPVGTGDPPTMGPSNVRLVVEHWLVRHGSDHARRGDAS